MFLIDLLWMNQAAHGRGHCQEMAVSFVMLLCRCLAASAWVSASRGLLCAYGPAGLGQRF